MTVRFDFTGQWVLVTGGTSGIGLAIARGFRDAGAKVAITGTRAGPGDYDEDLADLDFYRADMADLDSLGQLAAAVPRLDVLVNNAGTAVREDPLGTAAFERTIDINLNAVYRLSHLVRERLAARPGSIVNIASMTSYFGSPRVPGYGASKAAARRRGSNKGHEQYDVGGAERTRGASGHKRHRIEDGQHAAARDILRYSRYLVVERQQRVGASVVERRRARRYWCLLAQSPRRRVW